LVKSQTGQVATSQLADGEFFLNHGQIVIYLYTKQKPNTNPNLYRLLKVFNSVIYRKSH